MRQFIFGTLLFFFLSGTLLWAADSATEKIKDLERRLDVLEKQLDALTQKATAPDVEEIRRQVQILAAEVEKLRSGEQETKIDEARQRSLGLGPSAASVYEKKQGVSLAGYGEMLYENFAGENESGVPSDENDRIDFLRAILYFGYRFNDNFLFNSEIEFEHATTGEGSEERGEASVEFAHIDYLMNDSTTIRAGMVLLPMGFINEFHEPTSFLGARRPVTESVIIPSTWRENGAGILGRQGMFDYRAYVMNGFNAAGFSAEEGLREGRQSGSQAKFEDPVFVGRLDVTPMPGLLFGGSFYGGNAGVFLEETEEEKLSSDHFSVRTLIGEAHAEYKSRGFELRALYGQASLDHVAQLNEELGLEGEEGIGETLRGGYIQAGYNFWSAKSTEGAALTPYFRYEAVNTQAEVVPGFAKNPANDQSIWTFGLEYRPIFNIVVKADYQLISNEADTGVDQFNLLLGYSF